MRFDVGETVAASMYLGSETISGKMTFLEDGLLFFTEFLTVGSGDTFIAYRQISDVVRKNTRRLLQNGLSILTKDGTEYRFAVRRRENVVAFLNERSAGIPAAAAGGLLR